MLIRVSDDPRAMASDDPFWSRPEVEPGDDRPAARRTLETDDDPDGGRLARAARSEHDAELSALDRERQAAQRRDTPVLRGVDDEDVAELDEPAHSSRPGPRGSEKAPRAVRVTRSHAVSAKATLARPSTSGSIDVRSAARTTSQPV